MGLSQGPAHLGLDPHTHPQLPGTQSHAPALTHTHTHTVSLAHSHSDTLSDMHAWRGSLAPALVHPPHPSSRHQGPLPPPTRAPIPLYPAFRIWGA